MQTSLPSRSSGSRTCSGNPRHFNDISYRVVSSKKYNLLGLLFNRTCLNEIHAVQELLLISCHPNLSEQSWSWKFRLFLELLSTIGYRLCQLQCALYGASLNKIWTAVPIQRTINPHWLGPYDTREHRHRRRAHCIRPVLDKRFTISFQLPWPRARVTQLQGFYLILNLTRALHNPISQHLGRLDPWKKKHG